MDQVLHGVYQNITDGYLDLRRVMDMALLMDNLSEEDWLYLMKESQRIRMGTAFGTWLHVVKDISGKEPPSGIPSDLIPGWVTRRTIQGLDVAGGLLDRSAETHDGYTWLMHLIFTPNVTKKLGEIKKHLVPGEAMLMDQGHAPGAMPGFGVRLRSSLYHTKRLLVSSFRAMRALINGRPAS